MSDWIRVQGDQVHSLESTLSDDNGPIDLLPGTTVTLQGRLLGDIVPSIGGSGIVVHAGALVTDADRGEVRYNLSANDVAVAGLFYCQWKVIPAGSTLTQSFPEDASLSLLILPTS